MNRDEREGLEEELAMAKSTADEIRATAAHMKKFAPAHGVLKEQYEETAAYLSDLADDFEFNKLFRDIRHELDQAEQSQEDAARGAERRAYHASVGVK